MRARYAQHIPKGAKDNLGLSSDRVCFVDHLKRSDTDRASWSMHQFHTFGQQMIDSVLDDGVGLPAADLHKNPGPCLNTAHLPPHHLFFFRPPSPTITL